jgi:Fe(3+) dicitrate transport protein
MKKYLLLLMVVILASGTMAQKKKDSTKTEELKEVIIRSWQRKDISRLPDENHGFIIAGKKNEVIDLSGTNANIAIKNGRQLFSKIPGVFIYDMDGSGNQLNIATRGLDPHRSWEYNVRQNSVLLNSDMYGYPASHYSAPMESYEKIELVRGTGSLQYGAQFGGMINYITRKPDSTKILSFESINTAGSFNLLSTYNAVSGTYKKFSYYAYYYQRHLQGFRRNSVSDATAQFVQLNYSLTDKISLKAELGRSKYLYQLPGQLNDSMFRADPEMSTRTRNFYSPDILIPSLSMNWKLSGQTTLNLQASGIYGSRNSVMFDAFADIPDSINRSTGEYRNRQVDIDNFHSRNLEARLLHEYKIGKIESRLATGITYMNNNLHRRQLGKGTTGSDYDLSLVESGFGRDLNFRTKNIALYAENSVNLSPRWSVSPGLRYENGISKMTGEIKYYTVNPLPVDIKHRFFLLGVSSQYRIDKENSVYTGIAQSYRPVIFKDIVPASVYEQVDKNLEDAFGYNAEFGIRGKVLKRLQYDVSIFRLVYKNRLGTLVLQDDNGQPYTFRTNIGDSRTNGLEVFLQYKFPLSNVLYAGVFTSTSYMQANYTKGQISKGNTNESITGNKLEAVPEWISRNGLEILYKGFGCTLLYSYTSGTFSDALNTVIPPSNGARGYTPEYSTWDFNATLRTGTMFTIRAGVNNIFNKMYFTKRPTFYPGPGIWPSDGRNAYVTVGIKI